MISDATTLSIEATEGPIHPRASARSLIDRGGANVAFRPMHSPDLDPIELMFAKIMDRRSRCAARRWRRTGRDAVGLQRSDVRGCGQVLSRLLVRITNGLTMLQYDYYRSALAGWLIWADPRTGIWNDPLHHLVATGSSIAKPRSPVSMTIQSVQSDLSASSIAARFMSESSVRTITRCPAFGRLSAKT